MSAAHSYRLSPGVRMLGIQLLNRLLALALSVLLARVLGLTEYGRYAYAFAVVGLFAVLAEFGFPTLLERTVTTSVTHQRWPLLAGLLKQVNRWSLASAAAAAGLMIGLGFTGLAATSRDLFCIAALTIPLSTVFRCHASEVVGFGEIEKGRMLELLLRPAAMLFATLVCWALLSGWPQAADRLPSVTAQAPVSSGFVAEYAMVLQCLSLLLVLGLTHWFKARHSPLPPGVAPNFDQRSAWFRTARTFAFSNAAQVVIASAGLIAVGLFSTAEEAGYLRVATQGSLLVAIGLQSANALLAPTMARLWSQQDVRALQALVTRSVRWVTLLAVLVFLFFVGLGQPLLAVLYGQAYDQSYVPLIMLAGGQALNTAFGSVGALLNMTGHERTVARALTVAAFTCVALSVTLAPAYGAVGAAIATIGALAFWNVLLTMAVRRQLSIRPTVLGL